VRRVRGLARRVRRRLTPRRFPTLYDVNGIGNGSNTGRALLIYKAEPFLTPRDSDWFLGHQNRRRSINLAQLLGEFGYIVDVTDVDDVGKRKFRPERRYDVILSGRIETAYLDTPLTRNARRLYLATTAEHVAHNRNLRRRHELLRQRRGCGIPPRRNYPERMPFVASAHAIIGVGNAATVDTWQRASNAKRYPFNNSGFADTRFIFEAKDFASARKRFLFLASGSQVQKGLDLLLEIFPRHPELSLFVCSGFDREPEFCDCYRAELFETPNIHPVGWVRINGAEFYELIEKCAFIVSPSCSEGQAGSVVHGMNAGLIPLVTRETGVDVDEFGMTFVDDGIEEIEKLILQSASMPESELRERCRKTRAVAEVRHSEAAFMARWREILREVLARADQTRAS